MTDTHIREKITGASGRTIVWKAPNAFKIFPWCRVTSTLLSQPKHLSLFKKKLMQELHLLFPFLSLSCKKPNLGSFNVSTLRALESTYKFSPNGLDTFSSKHNCVNLVIGYQFFDSCDISLCLHTGIAQRNLMLITLWAFKVKIFSYIKAYTTKTTGMNKHACLFLLFVSISLYKGKV